MISGAFSPLSVSVSAWVTAGGVSVFCDDCAMLSSDLSASVMGAFSVPGGGGDGCSVQAQSRTIQRQAVRKRESDFFI